jgi:hypothetical protein
MDLETKGREAHTSDASACHPLDRSATLLLTHGARADFAISVVGLALLQLCVPEAESLCVCCSCAALCAVWWMASVVHGCTLQHPCALRGEQCSGALQSLTEEEWELVRGRCTIDERVVYDSAVICKHHVNEWLHRYKPSRCAACPNPLSSSGSMPCPDWMREQLGANHGTAVHVRPCYKAAVAAKKQQTADSRPMEVEQENIFPSQFCPLMSVIHALTQIHLLLHAYASMQPRPVQVLSPGPCRLSFPVGCCVELDECTFHHFPSAAASRRCCSRLPPLRLQP